MAVAASPLRLAVLPDYREEAWHSMDLCAEMLLAHAGSVQDKSVQPLRLDPPFHRILGRLPGSRWRGKLFNADRLLNRLWTYPHYLRQLGEHFDFFHIVDHSYAQLVHELPADRTGIYCHDLDTFRCLFEPAREPRPRWFRAMVRRTLRGLQRAAVVFHTTLEVRRQIEALGLVDPARLIHAPNGVSPEFTAERKGDVALPALPAGPFLLHVGSCIPRKRIDVLLDAFAAARRRRPELRLLQVGGEWSALQRVQIERLNLAGSLYQLRGIARPALAELYRRAALVVQPSEAEGFGLPVVEALACGAAVVASDIPVLREVGGTAAVYCPVGDVPAWAEIIDRVLGDSSFLPSIAARLAQVRRFTWQAQAATIVHGYLQLAGRLNPDSKS
jgi:glycosyltransferase involved in cell wall biosynthesis